MIEHFEILRCGDLNSHCRPGSSARRQRSLRAPVKLSRIMEGLIRAPDVLGAGAFGAELMKSCCRDREEEVANFGWEAFLSLRHRARPRQTTMIPVKNVPIDTSRATRTDAVSTPGVVYNYRHYERSRKSKQVIMS